MQAKLDLRIRRLHESMGHMRTADLSTVQSKAGVVNDTFYVGVDFSDGVSEVKLANIVSLCIGNIACLKDHLKAWCKANGKPFHGDTLIDANRDVGIVHDLWNRDKHFELKTSRTGLFPEIRDISRSISLSTQDQTGSLIAMTLDPRTGQWMVEGDGRGELVIDGSVVGAQGLPLGDLLEIAERAVVEWEREMSSAGIVLPPR